MALREGADANIGLVVMDEFHFYGDLDRGWAWQVPLLELPNAQFLLMSATLGDVTFLREDLTRRTGRPTALVANAERPRSAVPLLRDHADARDDPGLARHQAGADLRRPLHSGLGAGAGAGADERQRRAPKRRRPRSPT